MLWGKLMVQQLTCIYDAISPSLYVSSNSETKDSPGTYQKTWRKTGWKKEKLQCTSKGTGQGQRLSLSPFHGRKMSSSTTDQRIIHDCSQGEGHLWRRLAEFLLWFLGGGGSLLAGTAKHYFTPKSCYSFTEIKNKSFKKNRLVWLTDMSLQSRCSLHPW